MEWSRIKTILIWVFAIVNVFLLSIYFKETSTGNIISEDVVTSTVEILKQSNVTVDKDVIPRRYENVKICSVENKYSNINQMLGSVGIDDSKATVKGDFFWYVAETADEVDNVLERLLTSGYEKTEAEDGEYYYLSFENKVFFDSFICVKSKDGKTEINGKNWLGDHFADEGVSKIVSPAEILINFAAEYGGAEEISIKDIAAGYYIGERLETVRVTAAPVWKITVSDGTEYYFDMRNGDKL